VLDILREADIAYGDGKFVAVGENGKIVYSNLRE
jgi:hypothetical protein